MATTSSSTHPLSSAPSTPDQSRTTVVAPHGLGVFFLLAFAFSWTTWWIFPRLFPGADPMPAVVIGAFGPMVAAIIVTAATQGRQGVGALFRRHSLRRRGGLLPYAAAVLIVLAIAGSAALPVYLGQVDLDEAALRQALMTVPIQFLVIALVGGGNEELGWRGFALPRLQGAHSPLAANVMLGIIWAVWHAPLFFMEGTSQSNIHFPSYVLLCLGITVVLGYVFNSARGGVIAAVITHAAINVASGLKGVAVGAPASPIEVGLVLLVALFLLVCTRGRLGLPRNAGVEG